MKTYIDFTDTISYEGLQIPKDPYNRDYKQFAEEVRNGEAELVPHVPAPLTWEDVRYKREELLRETDWVGLNDITRIVNKSDWIEYRQKLRDLPQIYTSPQDVVWPEKPGQ